LSFVIHTRKNLRKHPNISEYVNSDIQKSENIPTDCFACSTTLMCDTIKEKRCYLKEVLLLMEQFSRISHDIEIMGGKACIKGTRVTVGMILAQIGQGKSIDEMLQDYPYITREDIQQAILYASWVVEARESVIVPA